jgi:hypothetical protein
VTLETTCEFLCCLFVGLFPPKTTNDENVAGWKGWWTPVKNATVIHVHRDGLGKLGVASHGPMVEYTFSCLGSRHDSENGTPPVHGEL